MLLVLRVFSSDSVFHNAYLSENPQGSRLAGSYWLLRRKSRRNEKFHLTHEISCIKRLSEVCLQLQRAFSIVTKSMEFTISPFWGRIWQSIMIDSGLDPSQGGSNRGLCSRIPGLSIAVYRSACVPGIYGGKRGAFPVV